MGGWNPNAPETKAYFERYKKANNGAEPDRFASPVTYASLQMLGLGREDPKWRVADRVVLLCLADMLTYFICALSGFYSLLLFYRAASLGSPSPTPIEHPAILIFLAVYGIAGITCKLPDALNKWPIPGAG